MKCAFPGDSGGSSPHGDIQRKPCLDVMESTAESPSSTKTKKFWKIEMQRSTPARITVS